MIAPRTRVLAPATCPSRGVFRLIGDRWTLLAILQLENGVRRFAQIRRGVGAVSAKVLAEKLRRLEEHGLVHRRVFKQTPPRVEYRLTRMGEELAQHIVPLDLWAVENAPRMAASSRAFKRRLGDRTPWQTPRAWE